jgi:hypothetical protein
MSDMIMGKHAEPVCSSGGAGAWWVPGGRSVMHGSGSCTSGWTCVVAAILDRNVENIKI